MNQPNNWQPSYPEYNSISGWEHEKLLTHQLMEYRIKDINANKVISRAETMCEMAISCLDHSMFFKYNDVLMRLIQYRINLLSRYKEALMYGGV